jgi:ATP-dependent Clp protease protease subunit
MIHNPWSSSTGEAKDMRHTADILDEVKDTIINAYQTKTKLSRNKISRLMDEETWMSARKAVADGFADGMLYAQVTEEEPVQNAYSFSRMAIVNSANSAMQRFFEQWQKMQATNGVANQTPAVPQGDSPTNSRALTLQQRVSLREKVHGRLFG